MTQPSRPSRRALLAGLAATACPMPALGQARVAPATEDQTRRLQAAIDAATQAGQATMLAPGRFRIARLVLPDGARLVGAPGTRLVQIGAAPVLVAKGARRIALEGISVEGAPGKNPNDALVAFEDVAELALDDCLLESTDGAALRLERCGGRVRDSRIVRARTAIFSRDATGLAITGNRIADCADNGILVWRSDKGFDGTQVNGNRIEAIRAESGGSGQNGNGVNVFRANGVAVSQNTMRDCAFSAVRNNAGDDVQIVANQASGIGEVALYCEFGFTGGVIAQNVVDGAASGISCTNFDQAGRLAAISGNLVRNLFRRPDALSGEINRGIGIYAEADAALTGNVVEGAPAIGIALGHGPHLRDVVASGNLIRESGIGIGVSVAPGAGHAQIVNNFITRAAKGAVVGFAWSDPATGDLATPKGDKPGNVQISGNLVR